jgi:hypothetical protein
MNVVISKADKTPLGIEKLLIDIPEKDIFAVIKSGDDLVRIVIPHAACIGRSGATREDRQEQDLRIGSSL